jgi:hypothetical protein
MNPANPNNPMQMRGEQKEGLGAALGKQKSLFSLWQCCAAWGLAAVMFLAGCIQTAPPCIVIRHGGACVLTMAYEGEEQEAKFHFARDSVVWRRAGGPVATRIVLADAKGNVVCSVGGDEFTERYRNAPGKGERDYALLLSADGIRWLSKKEFYKEAEAIQKLREEAEARKDWLTRELDARHGL